MNNELLLILSLVLIYTCVVLFYRFLGRSGLYCWTVLATIAANIEVLIVVDAFGMEQTLGNILFASTFLVTDILSETEGKRAANKAVLIGILTSGIFILISQSWLLYTPNARRSTSLHTTQSGRTRQNGAMIPKDFCGSETMAPRSSHSFSIHCCTPLRHSGASTNSRL